MCFTADRYAAANKRAAETVKLYVLCRKLNTVSYFILGVMH